MEKLNLKGYILTCNADIFFDETVEHVKNTNIHKEKRMYTQLRFEYTNKNLKKCKLFGFLIVKIHGYSIQTSIYQNYIEKYLKFILACLDVIIN